MAVELGIQSRNTPLGLPVVRDRKTGGIVRTEHDVADARRAAVLLMDVSRSDDARGVSSGALNELAEEVCFAAHGHRRIGHLDPTPHFALIREIKIQLRARRKY